MGIQRLIVKMNSKTEFTLMKDNNDTNLKHVNVLL